MSASFPTSVKSFGTDRVDGDYIPASDMNDVRAEIVALESAAIGGWMTVAETATYASASTFTVTGDRTSAYTKGRRVRWYQSVSPKYGVIASSSYGAGVTTVTILVSFEYTIAASTITALALSDLDNPQGWPDWFSWLPTYSASGSMTYLSTSTQISRYRVTGRTVQWMLRATGTTGGSAANTLRATLPVTALAVTGQYVAQVGTVQDGSGDVTGRAMLDTTGQLLLFLRYDAAVFGIGSGRAIIGEGFYEW